MAYREAGAVVHFAELQPEAEQSAESAVEVKPILPPPCRHNDDLPPEISEYRGGIMPPAVIAWSRERRRAAGLSQDEFACHIRLSRPQLANAENQRFGLSREAAARFVADVGRIRPRQIVFDLPLHAVAAARL